MECPFKLPVEKLEYEDPRISRDPERFLIVSPDGEFSLKRCNEKCADYIVQAINSYKKQSEALDEIEAVSCGEKQVTEDDSEGMGWIYKRIQILKEAAIGE